MPKLDFDQIEDVKDRSPLPIGKYLCKVAQVEEASTKGGDEMWKLRLAVASGEHQGRLIFDNLVFSQAALKRVKLVCERLGLDVSGEVELTPQMLQGKTCVVEVGIKPYEDAEGNLKERNEVPFAGYFGMDAPDVSGDDDERAPF